MNKFRQGEVVVCVKTTTFNHEGLIVGEHYVIEAEQVFDGNRVVLAYNPEGELIYSIAENFEHIEEIAKEEAQKELIMEVYFRSDPAAIDVELKSFVSDLAVANGVPDHLIKNLFNALNEFVYYVVMGEPSGPLN